MSVSPDRSDAKDIAGIFSDEKAAATAVEILIDDHFRAGTDLSVIASKHHQREPVRVWEPMPAYRVGAIGAGVGAALAGLIVAFTGIGFGPFTLIEWGPLWAIFEAAFTGGCIGFAIGAIVSIEMARPSADFGSVGIHDGVVWVGLHASSVRAERAREILTKAGAKHVMERDPETIGTFTFRHAA
jgi:hypothetical protein